MEALGVNYKNHLDQLKTAIQQSELLELYLESESEELYKQMIEAFESHIAEGDTTMAALSLSTRFNDSICLFTPSRLIGAPFNV